MKKNLFFILLITAFFGLFSNIVEYYLREKNASEVYKLYKNTTFDSVDNEYYLSYAYNFLEGRGWRATMATNQGNNKKPVGNGSYFRRVPGYPIIYTFFIAIFGDALGLKFLLVFQFGLFLLSVFCFYKILAYLNVSFISQTVITLLYGLIPYFYSWTFYTITEAITPFLMVFYLYFLLSAYNSIGNKKIFFYVLASFFVAYATLTRPYAAIALLAIPGFLWYDCRRFYNFTKQLFMASIIPIIMVGTWTIRNYYVTKEIVFLEKPYHPETLDRMKPEFEGLWNFIKCWEIEGGTFNNYQLPLFFAALRGDTSTVYVDKIIKNIPQKVTKLYTENEIYTALKRYQSVVFSQRNYFINNIAMPSDYSREQLAVRTNFDNLTQKYKRAYPLDYYVLRPMRYLKMIVLHSNTAHIFYFQEEFRNNTLLNILRFLLVLFHILLYLLIPINLFLLWRKKEVFIIVIIPLIFILFLIFPFQAIEQRYMLPFLPFLFLGIYPISEQIIHQFKKNANT